MKTPAVFRHGIFKPGAELSVTASQMVSGSARTGLYSKVLKKSDARACLNSLMLNKPVARFGLTMALTAVLLGASACGSADKDAAVKRLRSNTVVIGMPWEPRTLNPYRGVDSASYFSQTLIHGGLVRYNEKGDILPGLAESFSISPDGKTYTFNLRKNLKFSDGSPLTAITFTEAMKNSNTLARQPVGCGPFLIQRWDPGFELVFRANPNYWGGKPKSEYLVWRVIPDGNLLSAALFRGDVDVARVDGRVELGVLSEHSDVEFRKFPGARTIFLAFNTERSPYKNPTFRQAISMFIDKYAIVNNLYAGFATVPACDFPESGAVYNRMVRRWPYDKKEAERYLTASGFDLRTDGWFERNPEKPPGESEPANPLKKQQRLAFKIVTIKDFMDVAQVVAGDLQTAKIGVRVELVEYSTMKDKYLTTGDYDAVLFSRTQGPDPDCRLVWSKNGPLNYAHYKDDELDSLVESAYRAGTVSQRNELYEKIQALLGEKLPWVYLVQPSLTIAHKTYIKGIGTGVPADGGMPWDNPLFDAANWSREEK